MKMMKHIQTWLLITLLALSADGVVNAKAVSGHQNLSGGAHQSQTVLDALLHQGLEGVSTTNTSESPLATKGVKELTKSQQKGIRSLEKQISKHQQKLDDFKANPTVRPGMENLSKDVIQKQQQARIKHLETEINTFKNNIDKIKNGDL